MERLKNEFISTVSHELRTPLTAIRGAIGLLANDAAGKLPDNARAMLDITLSNSERLVRLINDILDIDEVTPSIHYKTTKSARETMIERW